MKHTVFMKILEKYMFTEIFGLRVETEATGFFVFSHIRMLGYFRLGMARRVGAKLL